MAAKSLLTKLELYSKIKPVLDFVSNIKKEILDKYINGSLITNTDKLEAKIGNLETSKKTLTMDYTKVNTQLTEAKSGKYVCSACNSTVERIDTELIKSLEGKLSSIVLEGPTLKNTIEVENSNLKAILDLNKHGIWQ